MKGKKLFFIGALVALLVLPGTMIFAQYDMAQAVSEMTGIATQLADVFGPNMGGISYIGDPIGYSFVPRFEIGIAGGIAVVPLTDVTEGSKMSLDFGGLGVFPIPTIAAHGKFTVRRIEIGGKIAGIPELEGDKGGTAVSNIVLGGKVRYKIFDFKKFALKGGASVGGFYEFIKGNLLLTDSDTIEIDADGEGTVDGELTNATGFDTTWMGHTIGGEAQANLQLLMFNFFAGSRVSKSFGKAESVVEGTSSLAPVAGATFPVATDSQSVSISEEAEPEGIDVFAFGGVEAKISILTITGRFGYNFTNENYTVDGGVRLQF